ncbi:MAG: ABC transporter ATP-binding protein [Kiritimatiellae bacterium]|nr:ABC transporter ATP-binding protein [Kiritimatiellia bacterium]
MVHALRDISFSCAPGELVALLGPSGCGKTTLLRLLAGLDRPTEGRIRVDGVEHTGARPDIGFVSQEGDLLPWRRVWANVALGLEIRGGMTARERRLRAEEALRRVRLPPAAADGYIHELSGGMRQRVALARALCVSPRVLLMDEPFGRLDEPTRNQLQDDLARLWETDRQTLIFVTHSIEEAVRLADRILIMTSGAISSEMPVALLRPRDRFSAEFRDVMSEIRARFQTAVAPQPADDTGR